MVKNIPGNVHIFPRVNPRPLEDGLIFQLRGRHLFSLAMPLTDGLAVGQFSVDPSYYVRWPKLDLFSRRDHTLGNSLLNMPVGRSMGWDIAYRYLLSPTIIGRRRFPSIAICLSNMFQAMYTIRLTLMGPETRKQNRILPSSYKNFPG